MTILIPIVALAILLLDVFFGEKRADSVRPEGIRFLALGALLAAISGVLAQYAPKPDVAPMLAALFVGAVAAVVGDWCSGRVAPMAAGVAAASSLHLMGATQLPAAQLALIIGLGVGVVALGSDLGPSTALVAVLCVAADFLGAKLTTTPAAAVVGSYVVLAGVIGAFVSLNLLRKLPWLTPIVVALVTVLGAFLAGRPFESIPILLVSLIGAAAGIVIAFLFGNEEGDFVRIGLAALIAVGIATVTFGLAKGTGMAVGLASMALPLLAADRRRALLAIGPLLALVLYRMLREQHPEISSALDIGQHYATLGLVIGVVLPLLPPDWVRKVGLRGAVGALIWGLLIFSIPALVILMMATKGAVGFVVGVGISALTQALRGERNLFPIALSGPIAAVTILLLDWLRDAGDLTRDEKVRIFAYSSGALLIAAIVLALLIREPAPEARTAEAGEAR